VWLGVLFCGRCMGCVELCTALSVACVRRWVCSGVGAVRWCGMSCGRARLMCLYAVCECAMCGAWLVGVCCFGWHAHHDADVPLCWVGLVASCVSARACVWCDGSGERGAVLGVHSACENVKHRGCIIRVVYNARLGRALPALCRAQ
jgi:hypothetical protein